MNLPLISVIVPTYNFQKTIDDTVKSIVNSTYKNLQIIFVDDGSTDSTPELLDLWKNKDDRIQVIHKQNSGVADSQNKALDSAKGKYVAFVDGDDYIDENLFLTLYELMIKYEPDVSVCMFKKYYQDTKEYEYVRNDGKLSIINGQKFLKEMFDCNTLYSHCWCKLYKREVIGNIRFEFGCSIGADNYFNYQVFKKCEKVVIYNKSLYNWVLGKNNTTKRYFNMAPWIRNLELYSEIFSKEYNNKALNVYIAQAFSIFILDACFQMIRYGDLSCEKTLFDLLKNNYKLLISCLNNKKLRLRLFLMRYFKPVYYLAIKFKMRSIDE